MIVRDFLKGIRSHKSVSKFQPIVPVIECNNNEILARSILAAFEPWGPLWMPFERQNFQTSITPGLGVWLTHSLKMAMIQATYQCLLDGRFQISGSLVVTSRASFDPRSKCPPISETVDTLWEQIGNFKDHPDGKVSGVSSSGDHDDMAISFMMCIAWSLMTRSALESRKQHE